MDETIKWPLVAVKSFGKLYAKEIIKNLLECSKLDASTHQPNQTSPIETIEIDTNINGYKCKIFTKYFENEVILVDLDQVDLQLLQGRDYEKHFEVAFFCFDKGDHSALSHIENICSFVCRNEIEAPAIIFSYDNEKSYNNIDEEIERQLLTIGTFALMDLYNRENDYHELYDLLRNHVWSNITVLKNGSSYMYQKNLNTTQEQSTSPLALTDTPTSFNPEEELKNFESLLQRVKEFQEAAKTFPRDTLLDNAEMLAEKFAELLGEDN